MKRRKDKRVKLIDCPIGLFIHDDTLCFKTDYDEAYIVRSGERFWGGIIIDKEIGETLVLPISDKSVMTMERKYSKAGEPDKLLKKLRYFFAYLIAPDFIDDLECRLSLLLYYVTGGLLSKPYYSVDKMLRAVKSYNNRICDDCRCRKETKENGDRDTCGQ